MWVIGQWVIAYFKNKCLEEQWQPCCYQAVQSTSAIQRSTYWLRLCFYWNGKLQSYSYHLRFVRFATLIADWLHLAFRLKNLSSPNTFNQSPSFQSILIQKIMFQSMVTLAQHPAGDILSMTLREIRLLSQVNFWRRVLDHIQYTYSIYRTEIITSTGQK